MAKRKAKRKPSSGGGGVRRSTKRKKPARRHHKKSFLSDLTNPTVIMNGVKFVASAGAGGIIGTHASKWMNPAASKLQKGLAILGIGMFGHMMGFPNMAAGAVGAMTAQSFPNGLADDGDASFADQDSLEDMPLFLDEEGAPMVLEEGPDGAGYRYLSADEVRMLEEAGAFDQYQEV